MKKTRILALVIAVLALVSLLFLVSCDKGSSGNKGDACASGEHKWSDWKSKGDATCTEDGTRYRRCPICKAEETDTDAGTATGHYFLPSSYIRNDDATCTTDGTETAACYLCGVVTDTRPAEGSALGHRFGNNPVADESFNGYNVFVCLRDGCDHKETFDNGTIDEDFEHVADGVVADNSKRYFTPNSVTELTDYAEGGKYLMLKRSADKIIGNTAFGVFFTPDYDLYKSKDYVISYDILITENTRDLVLLEGKKVATKQVFASYDSETGKIMVNGIAAYTVTPGEWINLAYVLDDVNGEFDVYVNNSLVISKTVYDKKDTYYLAAGLEYLGVYMIAEPKAASEFGIDNIKTYVGKAVTNPGEPMVKENITTAVSVPTNIMGTITPEWFETYQKDNKLTNDVMSKSFAYGQVDKDGKLVDTVVWQNFKTSYAFNLRTFAGIESYVTKNAFNEDTKVYDLSEYDSFSFTFYCDTVTQDLLDKGLEGYTVLVAFYCPQVNENGSRKDSYWQYAYTFTAEDVLNGEDGWKTVTVDLSKMGQTRNPDFKKITHFTFTASGWANLGVGDNGVAVDGTVVKIQNITLNKATNVTYAKPAEDCEHDFSTSRTIAPTCLTSGFDVKICSKCGGEQPDVANFVPATGHNYVTIQDIPAKCEENGYYSEKCEYCNDKVRIERVATGHIESTAEGYAPVVTAPTCYSTGITVRTCGVCAATYETDPTAMIDHEWDEGTVTTPATCTEEGVTTFKCIHNGENGCAGEKTEAIAATGHTPDEVNVGAYVPATCEKGGYTPTKCVTCQVGLEIENKEDKKLGHDWVVDPESDQTYDATCYADGSSFFNCSRCDKTKTEVVAATGEHNVDLNGEFVVITAPTCTTKGEGGYKCTNTGCPFVQTEEIPTVPHTKDETVDPVVTAPKCGVDGYTTYKCSVCAGEYQDDIVEAEEHDDGGVEHTFQTADCVNDGWERYTCVKCNAVVDVIEVVPSKGGHKYEIVIDDEMKKLVKHCTVCDEKIVATTDKLPTFTELVDAMKAENKLFNAGIITQAVGSSHTGEVILGTNGSHLQIVQRGGTKVVIGDNNGVDGVDKYFEWHMKPSKKVDHAYVNAYTDNKIGQGGKYVFQISIRLGTPGADGKWGGANWQFIDRSCAAASGDQFVDFATITDDGVFYILSNDKITVALSQEKFTKIELAMDVANNTLDLYVDGILVNTGIKIFNDTTAAKYTMSKFELEEIRFLQYNKDKDVGLGSVLEVANVALYGAERPAAILGIDYCGLKGSEHNYVAGTPVAPDCYNDGYTPYTCEFCGDVQNRDTVAKLEHVEAEVGEEYAPKVTAPTCFAGGYTEKLCKVCNQWYVADEVPALEHVMSAEPTADSVAPTCTTAGYNIFVCTNEGCTHTTKVDIAATGHNAESTIANVVAPNCTEGGYTVKSCPDCGKNFKVDPVPANGHAFGDFVRVTEPTCTTKGKETRQCANCVWKESQDVAALGHDWGTPVENELTFAPTCYADGSNYYECSRCDETKVEAVTARPEHTWSEYEVVTPATCTDAGKEVRTCTVEACGATSDRTITKLGHKLDEGTVTTAPTCTEDGIRTKTCTREGCEYTEEVAEPKLGHVMVLDPEKNTYNCTTDGLEALKCDRNCGYTETTEKTATGHKFQPDQGESDWTIVTPATCYSEGLRTRPCLNPGCTETEPQTIRMTDHNVDKNTLLTVEPTTEAEGYTYYKCVNEGCTHIVKVDIIPAITTGTQGFEFTEVDGGYYISAYTGEDTEIIIPATYKGKPVIGIDASIFAYDAYGITGVTIESGDIFTSEDYGIFAGCTLDYVVIKADVTFVPGGTFEGAIIGTLYNEGGAEIEDIDWDNVEIEAVVDGPKED